jgi:hypothetical protein
LTTSISFGNSFRSIARVRHLDASRATAPALIEPEPSGQPKLSRDQSPKQAASAGRPSSFALFKFNAGRHVPTITPGKVGETIMGNDNYEHGQVATEWAAKISASWRKSIAAVFETGNLLIRAKSGPRDDLH